MSEIQRLMNDFSDNYMGKIFYFCLRKVGNEYSAEELTQDISLCIFTELRRGVVPESFSAWVWQIARNRYAKWAESKHRRTVYESTSDIGDYEITDGTLLENEYVRNEDLALLRRELAFIASDYRNVVVAYYIDNKSVRDIASALSLPTGTVKAKLFRARNILKEGMNMSREFGTLSYKPEQIGFICNGNFGASGEPGNIISHLLYRNILLAAYRNPSTAEELAIEVGVALPYMESELDFLVSSTIMRKNEEKYETNIFIVSKQTQEKIFKHLSDITPTLTQATIAAVEYRTKCLNESGVKWYGGEQAYEDMKWALLMRMADTTEKAVLNKTKVTDKSDNSIGPWGHTLRPNGGEWDILGLESEGDVKAPYFVGLHGCGGYGEAIKVDFGQFKFKYKEIERQTPLSLEYTEGLTLLSVAKGTDAHIVQKNIDTLIKYGYIKKTESGYAPTFAVFYTNDLCVGLNKEQAAEYLRLCGNAEALAREHYSYCRSLIHADVPNFMKNNIHQINHACANIFTTRGAIFEEALRAGYIEYGGGETEAKDRMLGAYIVI